MMIRKTLKKMIVAGAMLAIAGAASADTYRIAIGGASAQADFWKTAGMAFMTTQMGCASAARDSQTSSNGVVRGLSCTSVPGGTGNDTVYLYYKAVASDWGCTNAPGAKLVAVADEATCTGWAGGQTCTGTKNVPLHVGCADVECGSLTQQTTGWDNGRSGYIADCTAGGTCSETRTTYGNINGFAWDPVTYPNMVEYQSIVVPFGFAVNNHVTKTRCTAPVLDSDEHVAYNKWGWQCVPGAQRCVSGLCEEDGTACTQNTRYVMDSGSVVLANGACAPDAGLGSQSGDCVSYYKCISGVCSGGVNQGVACTKASQCPGDIADTTCTEIAIDNLSRLQALLIFSGQVKNWRDFGPWYPDMPIVLCMRHAGSGTHATLNLGLLRDDSGLVTSSVGGTGMWLFMQSPEATNPATTTEGLSWHYRSSSNVVSDCLNYYNGGVGYVDSDKLMGMNMNSSHVVKLEGVEPTREKVKFGEYSFWSAQHCFYDEDAVTGITLSLAEELTNFAADADQLNNKDFGVTADFWATEGEMTVKKTSDFAYPVVK